jgi:hypothetical protein
MPQFCVPITAKLKKGRLHLCEGAKYGNNTIPCFLGVLPPPWLSLGNWDANPKTRHIQDFRTMLPYGKEGQDVRAIPQIEQLLLRSTATEKN